MGQEEFEKLTGKKDRAEFVYNLVMKEDNAYQKQLDIYQNIKMDKE